MQHQKFCTGPPKNNNNNNNDDRNNNRTYTCRKCGRSDFKAKQYLEQHGKWCKGETKPTGKTAAVRSVAKNRTNNNNDKKEIRDIYFEMKNLTNRLEKLL